MFNPTTYTLEDMPTHHAPNHLRPVICDDCFIALHPRRTDRPNPRSMQALRQSPYRFTYIDYLGSDAQRCWCCNSRRNTGRHLVEVARKA
jgi:hypothetical protein